jgi:NAD-dependent SIR2 family protein deacetylase
MRFIRIFKAGGENYDARQHKTAEWKCDVCQYVHWQDHINEELINKLEEKKCPKCGSYSLQDRVQALKLRKTELDKEQVRIQKEQADIQKEIEKVCAETEKTGVTGTHVSRENICL